jgi:hypothetical protein
VVAATAAIGAAAKDSAAIEPAMAMVRDLIGCSFDEDLCALRTGRSGLTLISLKGPVKSAVRDRSEAPYQPDLACNSE